MARSYQEHGVDQNGKDRDAILTGFRESGLDQRSNQRPGSVRIEGKARVTRR